MNRDQTLDILKGFGIILMVVAHSGAPSWLSKTIYTFHMPLFLLLQVGFSANVIWTIAETLQLEKLRVSICHTGSGV